MRRNS